MIRVHCVSRSLCPGVAIYFVFYAQNDKFHANIYLNVRQVADLCISYQNFAKGENEKKNDLRLEIPVLSKICQFESANGCLDITET